MSTKNNSTKNKKVRFSNTSSMILVEDLSLRDDASNLWYTKEETDLFKAWLEHQVHNIRSYLEENSALLDEELITVNAAAILGLEKYLRSELTVEYKNRRLLLQRAVLEEHRWQHSVQIPHPARLALISAKNSRWARERARAAALFLEQDVMQDFEEKTSLQPPRPRRGLTVEQAQEPPRSHSKSKVERIALSGQQLGCFVRRLPREEVWRW